MVDRANSGRLAQDDVLQTVLAELDALASGRGPLYRRLARSVAAAVDRGALPRGTRLPAERQLAGALGVSRGTVVTAYDALVADGVVERRRGSGTFVLGPDTLGLPPGREGSVLVHRLVDRSSGPSPVIDLSLSVLGDAAGLPDVQLTTHDLQTTVPDTGYTPWGLPGLRDVLAEHVTGWGLPTRPEQVVVTTGAQQALSAAAMCWVRPGDVVAVDDPTYPGAIAAFTQAGARLVPMAVDGGGVVPDEVARALAQRPALVYLQSGPHSPTGQVLSDQRRRVIADLLVEARVPLVEDAALHDLGWGPPCPPVAAWCRDAAVALIGSCSKLFWGGLRVGFVRAPEPVAQRFVRIKATHDLGSSAVSQLLAERLLRDHGGFGDWRRRELQARYEVLAAGLRAHLPTWEWTPPDGGMSLWVRLPATDAAAFAQVALRHQVAVASQAPLSTSGLHPDRLRLSFSPTPEALTEAVHRLAAAWDDHHMGDPCRP
ncbi:MAG TPA: PLP-dependent aminotransferase family protein [Acidimicrobiales bacterium]|nr:PLP-dependent aminotransferase family protein [Acidimicrobiales bacterium]